MNFVLLKDATRSLSDLTINVPDDLAEHVSNKLSRIVESHSDTLVKITMDELSAKIQDQLGAGDHYVVTLDGGTYFQDYEYSFEISRTCLRLGEIKSGQLYRMPRENCQQLVQQGMDLRDRYREDGYGRSIALCDDGIGTGESLARIINILRGLKLDVTHVFVLVNAGNNDAIGGTDVNTLFPMPDQFDWLSERDLLWGVPRSGISYSNTNDLSCVYGVPYTFDIELIEKKIGKLTDICNFRKKVLNLNIEMWSRLEETEGKVIRFSDVRRIAFLADYVNSDMRLVDYLESIMSCDNEFISNSNYF